MSRLEVKLLPLVSIPGSRRVVDLLVCSKAHQMKNIKVAERGRRRRSVDAKVKAELLRGCMGDDLASLSARSAVAIAVTLMVHNGLVMIALHVVTALGRGSDGGLHILENSRNLRRIADILGRRGTPRPNEIDKCACASRTVKLIHSE